MLEAEATIAQAFEQFDFGILDFTEVCKFHAAKRLARASVETACASRSCLSHKVP
jgi:hypothetical protein